MKPFRAIACSAAVVAAVAVQAPYASATVVNERESTHRVVTSEHDLNICGDLATFTFESTGHSTAVDTGNGFHFSFVEWPSTPSTSTTRRLARGQLERLKQSTSTPLPVMS